MNPRAKYWYLLVAGICTLLLFIMFYRREARMRTHIEKMEVQIEQLERQMQVDHQRETIRQETTAETSNKTPSNNFYSYERPTKKRQTPSNRENTSDTTSQRTQEKLTSAYEGKFQTVVRIELNTVDSATLVRVPGIAGRTAQTILHYREQLGGFYSADQLREKLTWEGAQKYMDSWCNEWFTVDEYFIQKLPINKLSFKELLKHPYLDFEEVKAICKWRDRHELVHNREELEQLGITDSTQIEKLLHYVEF